MQEVLKPQLFKVRFDRLTIWLTCLTLVILIGMAPFLTFVAALKHSSPQQYIPAAIWIPVIIATGMIFLIVFAPLRYELKADSFIIRRLLFPVKVEKTDIQSVERLNKEDMAGTWRTFGSGGYFGYWGLFTNNRLGSFSMYAGERKNYILLNLKSGKKIVIAGDNVLYNSLMKMVS